MYMQSDAKASTRTKVCEAAEWHAHAGGFWLKVRSLLTEYQQNVVPGRTIYGMIIPASPVQYYRHAWTPYREWTYRVQGLQDGGLCKPQLQLLQDDVRQPVHHARRRPANNQNLPVSQYTMWGNFLQRFSVEGKRAGGIRCTKLHIADLHISRYQRQTAQIELVIKM